KGWHRKGSRRARKSGSATRPATVSCHVERPATSAAPSHAARAPPLHAATSARPPWPCPCDQTRGREGEAAAWSRHRSEGHLKHQECPAAHRFPHRESAWEGFRAPPADNLPSPVRVPTAAISATETPLLRTVPR